MSVDCHQRRIGGMGRWEPDARGRLEQAALELYGERGFEQTTVAEIAERAGLTERTFFRYFADKREVLFCGRGRAAGAARRRRRRRARSAAPIDAVAAALEAAGAAAPGAPRIRPAAPGRHRRERRAAGARADQARLARLGARRRAAPARRRRPGREPGRRGGDRRLQGRVRTLGRRGPASETCRSSSGSRSTS